MHKNHSIAELGRNALLLTNNNTGCIGWPLVTATLGPGPASVALLMGMLVNLQFMPFAITFFEWQIWLDGVSSCWFYIIGNGKNWNINCLATRCAT